MICCSPRYNSCKDLQKTRRVKEYTIAACQSRPFSWIPKKNEELDMTIVLELKIVDSIYFHFSFYFILGFSITLLYQKMLFYENK